MNDIVSISDEELNSLTHGILTRYGIDFTCYEPESLKRRVVRVLNTHHFHSIHELWTRLLKDRSFIQQFMNEISVGMTSMFRDPVFWKSIRNILIQKYFYNKSISIWHAGCSTGEEVYSLAIVMQEASLLSKATAIATDINLEAIDIARKGEYHKIRMIENEKNYRQYNSLTDFSKYSERLKDGNYVKMKSTLMEHVTFSLHNLISDSFNGKFDIIFCRNVMIYFDMQAKKRLLQKFYESLNPGGYFVIGFYDTMLNLIDPKLFKLVDEEAKIFQKI